MIRGSGEAGRVVRISVASDIEPTAPTGSAPANVVVGAPAFAPGELIAQRYEVRRFIARGGMGEVYEVWDRALGESVALKTIRGGRSAASHAIERFKREIQLARKVTNPHVCRIFDLGFHASDDS